MSREKGASGAERRVLLCPRCFRSDIHMIIGGFVGQKYTCKDCGYVGSFVVEATPDEVEAFQREAREAREAEEKEPDEGSS